MKNIFVIVAALSLVLVMAACAAPAPAPSVPQQAAPQQPPSQPQQPVRGGTYIDSAFGDAASLQPLITQDNASSNFQALLYAPLMRTDPKTLERVGVLYEGSPVFNADGSKLTMKLRQGLKWSDGTPLTTKDIIFTWEKMMDPKVSFPYRKTYQDAFTEVKALDDYTVEYTLKTPGYCPAVVNAGLLDRGPMPKHVFESSTSTRTT